MNNSNLFLILGNQLFKPSLHLSGYRHCDFLLCEDFGLCSYYKHHKFKILLTLSAMRSYKDELTSGGFNVIYKGIEEKDFYERYISKLKKIIKKNKYKRLIFFEIEDKVFETEVKALEEIIEIQIVQSPMFLFSREEFSNFLKNNRPFMGNFYKLSRIKNKILVKENKPLGGKWSFDHENRKKLPKNIVIPKTTFPKTTKHTKYLIPIVNKIFQNNIGQLENFWLPTDRKSTLLLPNIF